MLKIEVKSSEVKEEEIRPSDRPGAKQFKPFLKRTQPAYVQLYGESGALEEYPRMFRIPLDKTQPAYPPGVYSLDPGSHYVDRNGNLAVGRVRLQPVKTMPAAKAA